MMKLVVLLALASTASSKRVLVAEHSNAREVNQGIDDYKLWVDSTDGVCVECKDMIANGLLEGIVQAGFVAESEWNADEKTLEVTLNKAHLYGEIASDSKVPFFWLLDDKLSFVFSDAEDEKLGHTTTVTMAGVHTEPAAQGVGLYEEFMEAKKLDVQSADTSEAALAEEQAAAYKYLYDWWWNKQKPTAKEQVGKITEVLKRSYDKRHVRYAVGGQFAGIFYQLATVCPTTINTFQFFNDKGESRVLATTEPNYDDNSVYARYGFLEKSQAMGADALLKQKTTLSLAEQAARSGMNFAKMMAYGNIKTRPSMQEAEISAGDPSAIANLLSWCAKSTPGEDPPCRKADIGRVAWGADPPLSMTANRYQNEAHKQRIEAAAALAAEAAEAEE